MVDKYSNQKYDYSKKNHVLFSEIIVPENSPQWLKEIANGDHKSSEILWNKVEEFEKRKDSQLAREIELSLPKELTLEQNITLAKQFIKQQIVVKGMVADWSLHNTEGNPHAHVMITMRPAVNDGFGAKNRDWNSKTLIQEWRKSWAETANKFLYEHGIDEVIDHRSYAEQGIVLIPQVHLGIDVDKMHTRNIDTDIINTYHDINLKNLETIADDPNTLFSKITAQKSNFSYEDVAHNLYTYIRKTVPLPDDSGKQIDSKIKVEVPIPSLVNDNVEFLTKGKIVEILNSIQRNEAVFTVKQIEKQLKQFTLNYEQLARAIVKIKSSENVISLGFNEKGCEVFTTLDMLVIEQNIQADINEIRQNLLAGISNDKINEVLADYELLTGKKLTKEQDQAIRHIVSNEAISCIVGRAGTGKSFSLAAAKAVWESQNRQIFGIAISGIASDGLAKDANLNSRTIASFLSSVENGTIELDDNTVIIMDEAGMTDSISMQKIILFTKTSGAKLVLVGDPAQLQPVGPGALFRAILEKTGYAEIKTVYRQREEWQRQATINFSKCNINEAVKAYNDRGCIHLCSSNSEAIDRLVADWQKLRNATHKDLSKFLVITHRNKDVQLINNTIRNLRVSNNEIADGYSVKTIIAGEEQEIRIAQNDRLLFYKNNRQLGIANGNYATVTYVNFSESGKVIDFNVKLDGSIEEIKINPNNYNNFNYGYASTIHKTQGVTVDHSFVFGGGNLNANLIYVAMTRHKETVNLYLNQRQYNNIGGFVHRVSRIEHKDNVIDYIDQIDDFANRRGIETNQYTLKQILINHLRNATDKVINIFKGKQEKVTAFPDEAICALNVSRPLYSKSYAEQCINDKPTNEDLQAVSHDTACCQHIQDLINARTRFFEVNERAKLIIDEYKTNGFNFEYADQFKEYLEFKIAYGQIAYDVSKNFDKYEQALDVHNIGISELNSYAESLNRNQSLLLGLKYLQVKNDNSRLTYELAYKLTSDKKNYFAIQKLGIDSKQLNAQANELIAAYVLNKAGINELVNQSPAKNYIDIIPLNTNKDGLFLKDEYELKEALINYLEARIVQTKVFNEVVYQKHYQYKNILKETNAQIEKIKASFTNNEKLLLSDKLSHTQQEYSITKKPSFKGGYAIAYQRTLQGNVTPEDYAALCLQLSRKEVQVHSFDKSMKR